MAYCDYEFYRDVYFGNAIAEEDFLRLSERASEYVYSVTEGLSNRVSGNALEHVKKAVCAIAEAVQDEGRMSAKSFSDSPAVSSETVGSWSRSYAATKISSAELDYIASRKRDALLLYLGNLPEFAAVFKVRSYPCQHMT